MSASTFQSGFDFRHPSGIAEPSVAGVSSHRPPRADDPAGANRPFPSALPDARAGARHRRLPAGRLLRPPGRRSRAMPASPDAPGVAMPSSRAIGCRIATVRCRQGPPEPPRNPVPVASPRERGARTARPGIGRRPAPGRRANRSRTMAAGPPRWAMPSRPLWRPSASRCSPPGRPEASAVEGRNRREREPGARHIPPAMRSIEDLEVGLARGGGRGHGFLFPSSFPLVGAPLRRLRAWPGEWEEQGAILAGPPPICKNRGDAMGPQDPAVPRRAATGVSRSERMGGGGFGTALSPLVPSVLAPRNPSSRSRIQVEGRGRTASHAASSQPWNTTASPTCRTDGGKRRSPSSAR